LLKSGDLHSSDLWWSPRVGLLGVNDSNRDVSPTIEAIIPVVVRPAEKEPLLRPFKGSGRMHERDSDAWFPVEFMTYHDELGKLRCFAYVRKDDGGDIPDGHYVFLDELGERSFRWRKWKGKWQFGWRYRGD
jgi:hypothetical protein